MHTVNRRPAAATFVPWALALALGWAIATASPAADAPRPEPQVLDVWPGDVPGETGKIGPEREQKPSPDVAGRPIKIITDISKPTLSVYRPPKDTDTGAAVVICPGGGYHVLAWDLEGTEVADWLNSIGVTGIILKYRVPGREGLARHAPALQDVQRAVGLVRHKAADWGVDPQRIGVLGFSAGGNLSALACTNYARRNYEPVDEADKASCRPDFGVLVYPAWLVEEDEQAKQVKEPMRLKAEFPVDSKTPPMFLAHAGDDPIKVESSVAMYLALKRAGVPAELHAYTSGGHGFGLRANEHPATAWPQRCAEWMKGRGLLTAKATQASKGS
jgi:acetyl esterase/lipase